MQAKYCHTFQREGVDLVVLNLHTPALHILVDA